MQEEEDNIQPVGRKHLPIEVHKQIVRKVSPFSHLATQSDSQSGCYSCWGQIAHLTMIAVLTATRAI